MPLFPTPWMAPLCRSCAACMCVARLRPIVCRADRPHVGPDVADRGPKRAIGDLSWFVPTSKSVCHECAPRVCAQSACPESALKCVPRVRARPGAGGSGEATADDQATRNQVYACKLRHRHHEWATLLTSGPHPAADERAHPPSAHNGRVRACASWLWSWRAAGRARARLLGNIDGRRPRASARLPHAASASAKTHITPRGFYGRWVAPCLGGAGPPVAPDEGSGALATTSATQRPQINGVPVLPEQQAARELRTPAVAAH